MERCRMGEDSEECPLFVYLKSYPSVVEKYLFNIPPFQHSNIPVVRRAHRLQDLLILLLSS